MRAILKAPMVLVLTSAVQLTSASAQALQLEREWEADLGTSNRGVIYRLAVCPDGRSYLSEDNGRLVTIGANGQLVADEKLPDSIQPTSLTRIPEDRIVAGSASRIDVVKRGSQGWTVVKTITVPLLLRNIVFADDQTLFVTGADSGERRQVNEGKQDRPNPFHKLNLANDSRKSFGASEDQLGLAEPQRLFVYQSALLWNGTSQTLIAVPQNPYEFRTYAADGSAIEKHSPAGVTPLKAAQPDANGQVHPNATDLIFNAVLLPGGGIATEVLRRDPITKTTSGTLEVFSSDFRLLAADIPLASTFGLLAGSSSDGGIYFTKIGPPGIRVVRARLK